MALSPLWVTIKYGLLDGLFSSVHVFDTFVRN